MALKHITDEQFQEYLDGNQPGNSWIEKHLENCDACKEQLNHYDTLYSALRNEHEMDLPASFADAVVARIADGSPAAGIRVWQIVLALAGFGMGLGAAVYLIGFQSIGKLFTGLGEFGKVFSEVLAIIGNYLTKINLNIGLVGLAAFALIFMVFLDHFIQSREKAISLFK